MVSALILLLTLMGTPACEQEDGSTQTVCVWQDETGVPVLNLEYGRYWLIWEGAAQ